MSPHVPWPNGVRRSVWALRLGLGLASFVGVGVADAPAAGWNVKNIVRQQFLIDDNVRLIANDAEPSWGFVSHPEINVSNRSPNLDLEAAVILDFNNFVGTGTKAEGAKERDSFDQHAKAEAEYRLERLALGVNGRYDRETARTSELTDTGRVESDATRESMNFGGQLSFFATETDLLQGSASYTGTAYDTKEFTDFSSIGVSAVWSKQLLPTDKLELIASGSRFETQTGSEYVSDQVGLQVGWERQFTQRLEAHIGGGPRYVVSDFQEFQGGNLVTSSRSSFGWIANVRAQYQATQNTSFEFAFQRSVDPSGSGQNRQNDRLDLSARYLISPSWSANLSGLAIRQGAADGATLNERRYFQVSSGLRWNFIRHLFLTASYRFRMQEFESGGTGATSNALIFSVVYDPPVW